MQFLCHGIGNGYFAEIDPTGSIGAAVKIFKIEEIIGPDMKLLFSLPLISKDTLCFGASASHYEVELRVCGVALVTRVTSLQTSFDLRKYSRHFSGCYYYYSSHHQQQQQQKKQKPNNRQVQRAS